MDSNKSLQKREWVYTQPPIVYELTCPNHEDHEIEWSEYVGHVWCATCNKDIESSEKGVFSGPIPVRTCELLGIRFDRYWFNRDEVEIFDNDHLTEPHLFIPLKDYGKYLTERQEFLNKSISK